LGGGREQILKSAPPLPFAVEVVPGVINGPLHNGDFIGRHFLPPCRRLFKKTKILYDKITYVKLQFNMTGANG
jgi:hypothetical protein